MTHEATKATSKQSPCMILASVSFPKKFQKLENEDKTNIIIIENLTFRFFLEFFRIEINFWT